VQRAINNVDAEIIVIDNHSTDNCIAYLKPIFTNVIFVESKENLGFARACNLGLRMAKGMYVLFLNPDTLIQEDTIEKSIAVFENNEKIGALGVRMIDGHGTFLKESKRSFPSPATSLFKLFGLSFLFPRSRFFSAYHLGHLNEHENHEVDVLCGAYMMARKNILDVVGGFDKKFFMYGEDIDLSFRIQQLGYKNYYLADTAIIHFKGESAKKNRLNHVKIFYRAMEIFVKKHYGGSYKSIFISLLRMGIWVHAFLSIVFGGIKKIGLFFDESNIFSSSKKIEIRSSELIAAKQQQYENVLEILQRTGEKNNMIRHTDDLQKLKNLQQQTQAKKIIFCTDSFSYKNIIALIEALPNKLRYRFYNDRTKTIIGG
jgi:GT2 family glycosyltransferase